MEVYDRYVMCQRVCACYCASYLSLLTSPLIMGWASGVTRSEGNAYCDRVCGCCVTELLVIYLLHGPCQESGQGGNTVRGYMLLVIYLLHGPCQESGQGGNTVRGYMLLVIYLLHCPCERASHGLQLGLRGEEF